VILPQGVDTAFFKPQKVTTRLPPANSQPWPNGDVVKEPITREVDPARLRAAVDQAFSDPAGQTIAFVVVHKGTGKVTPYGRKAAYGPLAVIPGSRFIFR